MAEGKRTVQFAPPSVTEDDVASVVDVLRSSWITTGPECAALESDLATYAGCPHVVAVSSCTTALEITLAFLRLPPGAGVAVPTWTFASTGLSAHRVGARPVLIDVDADDLNMSPEALERALDTTDIRAVIPVHMAGVAVSPRLRELCRERNVPIIEDAAHALGTRDDRGLVNGQDVVAACYSLYATKNLSSAEGGAIATFDPELDAFARSYRLHGLHRDAWSRYLPGGDPTMQSDIEYPGIKANLPDVLAALGRSQLRRFDDMQSRRRQLVDRYRQGLTGINGVSALPKGQDPGSADHLMLTLLDDDIERASLQQRLAAAGITTSVHFRPLHTYKWFAENAGLPAAFRVADSLRARVLSLPLHVGLTDDDVDYVLEQLAVSLSS